MRKKIPYPKVKKIFDYGIVSKSGLWKELRAMGVPIGLPKFKRLEEFGLFKFRKSIEGRNSFVSRKEAEQIKRLIWVYLYGKLPYPEDIKQDGK